MNRRLVVPVRLLDPRAQLPCYAHPDDAGADLTSIEEVTLRPGQRALVRTGIALAIPVGWVGLVHPRSGLAARAGISVVNAPGTVDAGYRGEILVNLINHDPEASLTVAAGDRVAQLVLQEVASADFFSVDSLPTSERAARGHGSSGGFTDSGSVPESVTNDPSA